VSASNPLRAAVLGSGSFGTCLAMLLANRGYAVDLWARDSTVVEGIERHRRNPRYLTDFRLPETVRATTSLEQALDTSEVVVSVVPSHAVREIWEKGRAWLRPEALVISASKGIEVGTGMLMSQVLEQVLPAAAQQRLVFLSGPSFAREIAEGRPTVVSLASHNESFAVAAQSILSSERLRCYTNPDVLGVELGGALKNVIAIAVGIASGMEAGLNARAATITRGLAEITRLGVALGADRETFQGLSGMGDLVLTCTGDLSRNRRVGIELGQGKKLDDILAGLHQVAEGVLTTRSAHELAEKRGVRMPISEAVYRVLYQGLAPADAGRALMTGQLRSERD
jgi:glycerol-3-phosphate dehydrogenase (NAD(P)+)